MSQEWKFTAPVFVDDTITAEAEVLSAHATKPVTTVGFHRPASGRGDGAGGRGMCATRSRGPSDPRGVADPGQTSDPGQPSGFRQAPVTRQVLGPSRPRDSVRPPGMPLFTPHRACPEPSRNHRPCGPAHERRESSIARFTMDIRTETLGPLSDAACLVPRHRTRPHPGRDATERGRNGHPQGRIRRSGTTSLVWTARSRCRLR